MSNGDQRSITPRNTNHIKSLFLLGESEREFYIFQFTLISNYSCLEVKCERVYERVEIAIVFSIMLNVPLDCGLDEHSIRYPPDCEFTIHNAEM
jgi:hypothetical protein